MDKEIMRKLSRDMKLSSCLYSIKECCEVARDYIDCKYIVNDVNELVVALNEVPEYIEEIENIILEMANEYEEEIEVLRLKIKT